MKNFLSLITFFLAQGLNAEVLKHESSLTTIHEYSFKEACEVMGSKNFELISAKSSTELDCMGKIFKTNDFCLTKLPKEESLARALIREKENQVVCEISSSVRLTISCDARDARYCLDAEKGCLELGKIYAMKLEAVNSYVLERTLHCHFSASAPEVKNTY